MEFKNLVFLVTALFSLSSACAVDAIKPVDADKLVSGDKAVLFDVREMAEVKETGIAKPAAWLPKSEIDANSELYQGLVKNFDKKTPLIFYCRSGKRAAIVAEHFEKIGFKSMNMGSLADWQAAKLPVVPFEQRK